MDTKEQEETRRSEPTRSIHKSVLLHEAIDALNLKDGMVVLDGTINGAGHSSLICKTIGASGVLLGIDLDRDALARASNKLLDSKAKVYLTEENYRNMDIVARKHGITSINAILLDLGFSSDQLEMSGRGFSFQYDEPLFLTFRSERDEDEVAFTAKEIINTWSEEHLSDILFGYGEERFARRIARAVVTRRENMPIKTTKELVDIVRSAVPRWYGYRRLHPATRVFQALRIAVNDEIESLREGIEKAFELLSPHGRLAIISFHSIEDRVVKHAFINKMREGRGVVVNKKPITPSEEEVKSNPRARSAKLRVFESNGGA